tara:strand:+ start:501 stop:713 length:213 start_codon:yes stop_codon:yes gene_type:complete
MKTMMQPNINEDCDFCLTTIFNEAARVSGGMIEKIEGQLFWHCDECGLKTINLLEVKEMIIKQKNEGEKI